MPGSELWMKLNCKLGVSECTVHRRFGFAEYLSHVLMNMPDCTVCESHRGWIDAHGFQELLCRTWSKIDDLKLPHRGLENAPFTGVQRRRNDVSDSLSCHLKVLQQWQSDSAFCITDLLLSPSQISQTLSSHITPC